MEADLLTTELLWTLAGLLTVLACVPVALYISGRLKPRGSRPAPDHAPEAPKDENFPYSLAILARVLEADRLPQTADSTAAKEPIWPG